MTFLVTLLVFTAIIWALLVRSKMRQDRWEKQQSFKFGQSQIHANTSEAGHAHTYYVTKNADEYARIFVPKS